MKKRISKVLAISLCLVVGIVFTGCQSVPFNYDMSKYVEMAKYTGLTYDASKLEVSEKEILDEIQEDLEKTAEDKWVKTGTVKNGDTVKIDYSGTMNGKAADGTTGSDYELKIGSNTFIDGFESGLVGELVGTTTVLDLKFPDTYTANPDYAGKKVKFTVEIKSKKVSVTPELTTKWVKANTSFKTIKAYKAKVKDDLYQTKVKSVGAGLLTSLTEKCKILDYPEKELDQLVEAAIEYYTQLAENNSTTYEDLVKNQLNMGVDEFKEQLEEQAKTEIAQEVVAYYIAKKEGIEATSEDVEQYLEDLMTANGLTEETFEDSVGMTLKEYKKKYSSDIMVASTVQNVEEFLVKNGKSK